MTEKGRLVPVATDRETPASECNNARMILGELETQPLTISDKSIVALPTPGMAIGPPSGTEAMY